MRWGGVTIFLFLIFHLLNFTIGKFNPQGGETNNPYVLMVDSFDTWWLTLIYLVAMAMLGGLSLMFPSARPFWGIAGVLTVLATAATLVGRTEIRSAQIHERFGVHRPPFN